MKRKRLSHKETFTLFDFTNMTGKDSISFVEPSMSCQRLSNNVFVYLVRVRVLTHIQLLCQYTLKVC